MSKTTIQNEWLNHYAGNKTLRSALYRKATRYLYLADDSQEPVKLGFCLSFAHEVKLIREAIAAGKTASWDVSPSNPMRVWG